MVPFETQLLQDSRHLPTSNDTFPNVVNHTFNCVPLITQIQITTFTCYQNKQQTAGTFARTEGSEQWTWSQLSGTLENTKWTSELRLTTVLFAEPFLVLWTKNQGNTIKANMHIKAEEFFKHKWWYRSQPHQKPHDLEPGCSVFPRTIPWFHFLVLFITWLSISSLKFNLNFFIFQIS